MLHQKFRFRWLLDQWGLELSPPIPLRFLGFRWLLDQWDLELTIIFGDDLDGFRYLLN